MTVAERIKDLLLNPHLIPAYAKSSCRHCYGRGIREMEMTGLKRELVKEHSTVQNVLCDCVKKNIRREVESNG